MVNSIKSFLDNHIKNNSNNNKLIVFPLQCGIGKSTYIKYKISECLSNDGGLIVVTDAVDRLKDYIDDDLVEYLDRNKDKLVLLTSENITYELPTLHKKKIILMATQRYFNLTAEQIKELTKTRHMIIFDEKPYIFEMVKIDIKTLNDIDTALKEALDDTVNQTEKQWLIEQWQTVSRMLQTALIKNEASNNNYKLEGYFNAKEIKIDNLFNSTIEKYRNHLNKYNINILKNIKAVNQLLTEGIITSQKTKSKKIDNEYSNYFTVLINNIQKLTNINASVFILDGTADISPEYKLNCIDIVDCNDFKRDLSKLNINIVNINTSKNKLCNGHKMTTDLLKIIIDFIKSQPQKYDAIFTYKYIAQNFQNDFKYVNWFGNIKGTNLYRNTNNIVQIGLSRTPDLMYRLFANAIGQINDKENNLIKRVYDDETITRIMNNHILSDIEQNIFRSKIRNTDNSEQITYTLFFDVKQYSMLIDMIRNRYCKYGAKLNFIDTPIEIQKYNISNRRNKRESHSQKIINWLTIQPKEKEFKISDMLKDVNISYKQFKEAKKNNIKLNNVFKKMQTNKKGYYKI